MLEEITASRSWWSAHVTVQKQWRHYPNTSKQAKYQRGRFSHNVIACIGLDLAVTAQVKSQPRSLGLHRIIFIAWVHLHSILPLIHMHDSRWRLKSLLRLCNIATLLQHPVQCTNIHTFSYTHVLLLPSSHAMSLSFLSATLSPSDFLLDGSKSLKTALVRPKLEGEWWVESFWRTSYWRTVRIWQEFSEALVQILYMSSWKKDQNLKQCWYLWTFYNEMKMKQHDFWLLSLPLQAQRAQFVKGETRRRLFLWPPEKAGWPHSATATWVVNLYGYKDCTKQEERKGLASALPSLNEMKGKETLLNFFLEELRQHHWASAVWRRKVICLSYLRRMRRTVLSINLSSGFLQSVRLGCHQVDWEISINGKIWRKKQPCLKGAVRLLQSGAPNLSNTPYFHIFKLCS